MEKSFICIQKFREKSQVALPKSIFPIVSPFKAGVVPFIPGYVTSTVVHFSSRFEMQCGIGAGRGVSVLLPPGTILITTTSVYLKKALWDIGEVLGARGGKKIGVVPKVRKSKVR